MAKIPFNDLVSIFRYQGVVTLDQAIEFLKEYPDNTVRYSLEKYTKSTKTLPNSFVWSSYIKRPWRDKSTGRTPSFYGLTPHGAEVLKEITGVELDAPENKNDKSTQHALALVDIALACTKMGYACKINRQVNIPAQSDEAKPTRTRPDVQFTTPETVDQIHFVEFEQKRYEENLYSTILARMYRWDQLLTNPEQGSNYSKDILVLFWFGEDVKKDDYTMDVWMEALYNFEEKEKRKAPFNVYYMNFIDFFQKSTFDNTNYKLLIPAQNPANERLKFERENQFQKEAIRILTNLDKESSSKALNDYADHYRELWRKLQTASNRQEFFFSQTKQLYEMSKKDEFTGYAEAAIPWPSVFLVRYWIEQEQLRELREDLITGLTKISNVSAKNQQTGAMVYEEVVWDTLFRFFNFASGGPLSFKVNTLNIENMDRCYAITPEVRIETPWPGVFESPKDAEVYKAAINWFIDTLLRYQKELGLVSSNRIKKISKKIAH